MASNRWPLAAISLLLLSGCGKSPEGVFVNVESLLKSSPSPTPGASSPPTPPPGPVAAQTAVLSAVPPRFMIDRAAGRIEAARKLIEADRQGALKTLTKRLATVYVNQIDQDSQDKFDHLRTDETAIIQRAYDDVRTAFEAYAEERGPIVTRLQVVDSPQYQSSIRGPLPADSPLAVRHVKESADLHAQIKTLDDDYARKANAILAAAQATIDRSLTQFRADLEKKKGAAQERATQDATKQIRSARAGLARGIRAETSVMAPPESSRQVSIQGSPPLQPAPQITPMNLGQSAKERSALVELELEIWLKTNGYRRSVRKEGVRDATEEFKQWRAERKVGP